MKTDKATWLRLAMIIFASINQILIALNKPILPLSEGEAEVLLNTVINVLFALIGFWKNNSFTNHAIEADKRLSELKKKE